MECTTILCDYYQSSDHVSASCPLLSAPKPTVQMYGFAHEELVFFESILTGTYRPKQENVRMGKITITGGVYVGGPDCVLLAVHCSR